MYIIGDSRPTFCLQWFHFDCHRSTTKQLGENLLQDQQAGRHSYLGVHAFLPRGKNHFHIENQLYNKTHKRNHLHTLTHTVLYFQGFNL